MSDTYPIPDITTGFNPYSQITQLDWSTNPAYQSLQNSLNPGSSPVSMLTSPISLTKPPTPAMTGTIAGISTPLLLIGGVALVALIAVSKSS